MSPERTLGNPLDMGARSDIYPLGVIVHELLSGKLPYVTRNLAVTEVIRVIREHNPESLSKIDSGYRGDMQIITAKALEKDKERQYS
jgi:eukaryotic-like serine/threonine-protein kinase